jgi:hypothetical protein
MLKLNWTEHNPSATISVGEEEWVAVVAWLYENWDIVGGLSFLPRDNHVYRLAPYESIDKATYERLTSNFPQIDYSKLYLYEKTDETEQAKELACAGGTCEIAPMNHTPFDCPKVVDRDACKAKILGIHGRLRIDMRSDKKRSVFAQASSLEAIVEEAFLLAPLIKRKHGS